MQWKQWLKLNKGAIMKTLMSILIIVAIIALAVFTGSWIFDIIAWLFEISAKGLRFLSEVFNFFGWNNGILGG